MSKSFFEDVMKSFKETKADDNGSYCTTIPTEEYMKLINSRILFDLQRDCGILTFVCPATYEDDMHVFCQWRKKPSHGCTLKE